MAATLDQLAEALENTRGRTPLEVIDAFCPVGAKIGPFPLVPITAGHDLFLARVKHPLATGGSAAWGAYDVATALFAFTRSSRELFRMIDDDSFESALYEFLDDIPVGVLNHAAAELMAHWIRARATAVAMKSPHPDGSSKKKRASAGGSR
jgi:hypothetical protein